MKKLFYIMSFLMTFSIFSTASAQCLNANGNPQTECSSATTQVECSSTTYDTTDENNNTTVTIPCYWHGNVTGDANQNAFVKTLCNVLKIVQGNGGKAFAAFAVISIGIGFFTGKVSWGLMIGVAAGIAAMFGAPTIVAAIAGGDAYSCGANAL